MQVNTCPGALVVLRPELWVSRSYSTTSRKRCLSVRRLGVGCRAKVPSSGSWNSAGNDLEHGRSKNGPKIESQPTRHSPYPTSK